MAQKRFIADASHELRTPLAILMTDLDVASSDEEALRLLRPMLERDRDEVDRMASMVDDLLLLSRIDALQAEVRLATRRPHERSSITPSASCVRSRSDAASP